MLGALTLMDLGEVLPWFSLVLKEGEGETENCQGHWIFLCHEKIMNVVLIFAVSERESCCIFIAALGSLRKCISHCVT